MAIHLAGMAGRFPLAGPRSSARSLRLVHQEIMRSPAGSRGLELLHAEGQPAVLVQEHLGPAARPEDGGPLGRQRRVVLCGLLRDPGPQAIAKGDRLAELEAKLDREGASALRHVRGEFVLAYVRPDGGEALLFRSVTCPQSLFHRMVDGALLWSTNPLFLFPAGRPTLDDVAPELLSMLVLRLRLRPTLSFFRDLEVLPPGWCLTVTDSSCTATHLDDFRIVDNRRLSLADAAASVRDLTHEAVATALPTSRRVGVALSGGIDSSVVCDETAKTCGAASAFHWTLGAAGQPGMETAAARAVAAQLGIPLVEASLQAAVAPGGDYVDCHDDCFVPHNFLGPEHALARAINDQPQPFWLLWGAFADQLFETETVEHLSLHPLSRYSIWRAMPTLVRGARSGGLDRDLVTRPLRGFGSPCRGLAPRHRKRVDNMGRWITPAARQRALEHLTQAFDERVDGYDHQVPRARQARTAAITYVALKDSMDCEVNNSLTLDVMLPYGVVTVFPLLDRQLIEFCLSLGHHHKAQMYLGEPVSKVVWRYAYGDRLPRDTVARRMEPLLPALAQIFVDNNLPRIKELLGAGSVLRQLEVLDGEGLALVLADPRLRAMDSGPLLDVCVAELWLRRVAGRGGSSAAAALSRWRAEESLSHRPMGDLPWKSPSRSRST